MILLSLKSRIKLALSNNEILIKVTFQLLSQHYLFQVGIDGITYAGNHGLEILHPDGTKFVHPMPREFEDKVADLLKALQEQVCKEGAWVENKGALLTFHYRETPLSIRGALADKAKALIEAAGFKAAPAHMAIEAKPPVQWNKGRASIYILRTAFGVDWSERIRIIYAGDDVTDEDAMEVSNNCELYKSRPFNANKLSFLLAYNFS